MGIIVKTDSCIYEYKNDNIADYNESYLKNNKKLNFGQYYRKTLL